MTSRNDKGKDILAEGMKRFQQIMEYTTINRLVDEGGDDVDADAADGGMGAEGGMPDAGGGQPTGMDMGGDAMGMDAQGGDAMDAMQDGGAAQMPQGFDPQFQGGADAAMGGGQARPDDEVVDITELVDKQDETERKVVRIGDKFDTVMKALGQFEELIRTQNGHIDDLKAEFERRMPTQVEKLSMQSASGYPFNVAPEDYWKRKEETSNYSREGDDNGKESPQYTITRKDLEGTGDWKSISDSLTDDDFLFNQTLNKILGR